MAKNKDNFTDLVDSVEESQNSDGDNDDSVSTTQEVTDESDNLITLDENSDDITKK